MDLILPSRYPLAPNHPWSSQPKDHTGPPLAKSDSFAAQGIVHLVSSDLRLRCRPGEIYLGASTSNGKLHLKFFWDGNVFNDETVKEWLAEVKGAILWYLADDVTAKPIPVLPAYPRSSNTWFSRPMFIILFVLSAIISLIYHIYLS